MVMYPSRSSFEAWEKLGNEGWGPDEMAPYLRKFHTYIPPSEKTTSMLGLENYMKIEDQGVDGPVPVTMPNVYSELNMAWDETFRRLGWNAKADPIAGEKIGAFTSPLTVDGKARRGYAAAYYTSEVANRPNLQLRTDTLAEKVLFDELGQKPRATGVQVRAGDSVENITARREVILSAGSLNSPQLLELSGIGQAELLGRHGIPVLVDSNGVGENLQDHASVVVCFEVADGQPSGDMLRDPSVFQTALKQHEETGSGLLAGLPLSTAYLPSVDINGPLPTETLRKLIEQNSKEDVSPALQRQYDILQTILLNSSIASVEYIWDHFQFSMEGGAMSVSDILTKRYPGNYGGILALNNHPFSRGTVHILSSRIEDKPLYDPNYLSHPLDLELLARHTQYIDRILRTEPFTSLIKPDSRIPVNVTDLSDLETAKEVVKDRIYTTFHPAGTCAMMPADMGGVVDSRLRVHGTSGLRVVDASIFPLEPAGNIQATIYAMAERAADLIKEDNRDL